MTAWQYKIFVGRDEICEFLKRSWNTIYDLYKKQGLPLVKEGGFWTLSNADYEKWRKSLPNCVQIGDNLP